MNAFADTGPTAAVLPDGRRLHLQHGPIDLVIDATGSDQARETAFHRAVAAFRTVLVDLVDELGLLRAPISAGCPPAGPVAARMWRATAPHASVGRFVTPMAAVAGAVADHVLAAMTASAGLDRAYVNNGGDIALFLGDGASFDIGVCADPRTARPAAVIHLDREDRIGGIATSGWRGRSHSLGIADAVTVLAADAATADAAATLIANAVDVPGSPRIRRSPARLLAPDSDLGDRPVTTGVDALSNAEITTALDRGCAAAEAMRAGGLIVSAFIALQGEMRTVPHRPLADGKLVSGDRRPDYPSLEAGGL